MDRQPRRAERERPHALLGHHERHHLAVERAVVETDDAVHADRDRASALGIEDGRAERASGTELDVSARDGDRKPDRSSGPPAATPRWLAGPTGWRPIDPLFGEPEAAGALDRGDGSIVEPRLIRDQQPDSG